MSSFKDLNELEQLFERAEEPAENLDGTQISFEELFSTSFMQKYTSFSSFKELLDAGGFHAETNEDFRAIPDNEFNKHIAATTQFRNFKEMGDAATACFFTEKLGF